MCTLVDLDDDKDDEDDGRHDEQLRRFSVEDSLDICPVARRVSVVVSLYLKVLPRTLHNTWNSGFRRYRKLYQIRCRLDYTHER